ncbi:MAG TPA: AAA family ATPase, partial [Burkholderiaceae bacterium]|nr:AAA family ATPase [Burkholderiaceae bacterium]
MYQLLTGVHPFDTGAPLSTLTAIANQQPLALSHWNATVPDDVEQLVAAMLHKEPQLRPTATEVEAVFSETRDTESSRRTLPARPIVRREAEIALLNEALDDASAGRGRVICIAGEPGIGKTTLIEDFLNEVSARCRTVQIARGQCSERLTDTEAYLPVIDALENLLRCDSAGSVSRIMQAVAPSWYAQISPQARGAADLHAAPLRAQSQQSLLREFCKLLEECGRRGPVILFFDDVHWADLSTVDLLAHLGHQCHGLRTLVVVTYRPTELLLKPHPFYLVKLELQGKGVCRVIPLNFLTRADVDRYFALAFEDHTFPPDFGDEIFARTEGSPLFMVDLLGYLTELGVLGRREGRWSVVRELPNLRQQMPESVRSMIERKLGRLEQCDRQLLSAAAVQGYEFDSATVAEAVGLTVVNAEERLEDLDRVHGLIRLVREQEFPDRTLTLRYAFVHALYQQSFYNGLSPRSRAGLSSIVGR